MKKWIIFLLLPLFTKAQDTTNVSLTDSAKMYTYKGVYATVKLVNVTAPGASFSILSRNIDSSKWITNVVLSVYSSKADYKAGKQELFLIYCPVLLTDKFPTQKEILDRMRQSIK